VADGVDRAVDAMQAPVLDALGHGTRIEAHGAQLIETNESVLGCRQPRDVMID
jgi:hypothetical protein